jgi:PAS domain S-box-containing protein
VAAPALAQVPVPVTDPGPWRLTSLTLLLLAVLQALWTWRCHRRAQRNAQAHALAVQALAQAEQQAQLRLTQIDAIASRLPGVVYQYCLRADGSSCFPYASEAIHAIYRVSPEQVRHDASPVFANLHPEDLQRVGDSIRASAQQLTPWQCEYRVRFDDGTERWLYGNALPSAQPDGSVLWHGFITDVTERKAADDKLRQLSRIIEQVPVGVIITSLQGEINYTNPWFSRMTGYPSQELLGQTPRLLQSGLTPRATYDELWHTLAQGKTWSGELHNRRKDGSTYIEQATIAPVLDGHGLATHYVALKEDISQRKQADLALKASLQEKVALLNEVHHRVKNNLQIISSLLRLEGTRTTEPDTRDTLRDMQSRILAMALLHESLYRAGTFTSVNLGTYLQQLTSQAFRAQGLVGQGIRLVLELKPAHVSLDVATPCGLLVNELLSNSLKHAFPQGRLGNVWVQSQPGAQSGTWRLCVRDDGVGLPGDFEARRKQTLGLQLVSDLAVQLGGELRIGDGPGATFTVEFALA